MTLPSAPDKPLASPGKTLSPEFQKALGRVTEISSLPEVTAKIVAVVEDPKASARDIHDVVRTDPALAAKVLKIVNSAFYGLPAQVASLDRAILMLGLSAIKNLALATSLSRLIKPGAISDQFQSRDLWQHCVAVAVAARLIAQAGKVLPPDEAFVAGLVHDMGLIVIQQLYPEKMKQVAEECHAKPQDFCATETRIIGADHETFGGALATKWRFPPGVRHAIGYHHDPNLLQQDFKRIAAAIHLADTLCAHARLGFWLTAQLQQPVEWMLELNAVSPAVLEQVTAELPARYAEVETILGTV